MVKRTTALFFIFLANIVLLVHAVVPHHHHQSIICIESSHCQFDCYALNHSSATHDHEHDGENSPECCALKQPVLIPANSLRQEFKCLDCDDHHIPFVHFQAILFRNEFKSFVPRIISGVQIPFITFPHSSFVSASIGLRAPPVV